MVEYARTFLMSVCVTAMSAPMIAVMPPVHAMKCSASGVKIGNMRAER